MQCVSQGMQRGTVGCGRWAGQGQQGMGFRALAQVQHLVAWVSSHRNRGKRPGLHRLRPRASSRGDSGSSTSGAARSRSARVITRPTCHQQRPPGSGFPHCRVPSYYHLGSLGSQGHHPTYQILKLIHIHWNMMLVLLHPRRADCQDPTWAADCLKFHQRNHRMHGAPHMACCHSTRCKIRARSCWGWICSLSTTWSDIRVH